MLAIETQSDCSICYNYLFFTMLIGTAIREDLATRGEIVIVCTNPSPSPEELMS